MVDDVLCDFTSPCWEAYDDCFINRLNEVGCKFPDDGDHGWTCTVHGCATSPLRWSIPQSANVRC